MGVRRLHVEGYRSLRDVTVEFGAVTVLVGPNGSGKTNLYRALRLAHACGGGRIARTVVQEGGMPSIVYAGRRRHFLFLAAVLLSQRPPVMVVLNEPEASLHDQLLPALSELVAAAASRMQVVLTTHSLNLAASLLEREGAVGVELKVQAGTTSVSRL
jgi:predicted ATPase